MDKFRLVWGFLLRPRSLQLFGWLCVHLAMAAEPLVSIRLLKSPKRDRDEIEMILDRPPAGSHILPTMDCPWQETMGTLKYGRWRIWFRWVTVSHQGLEVRVVRRTNSGHSFTKWPKRAARNHAKIGMMLKWLSTGPLPYLISFTNGSSLTWRNGNGKMQKMTLKWMRWVNVSHQDLTLL